MITIPFKGYFKHTMLTGKKTATSRTRRYGNPGDRFQIFGETFELIGVNRKMLGDVAKQYFREEGFLTPEEFLECWGSIHPRAKFDLTLPVWLHQFRIIKSPIFERKPE